MLPFWKTMTFWISACSWFTVLGGHYAGVIPSPYGLVLGNVVVMVYAVMRCLQKRQSGLGWKSILGTSEFIGTILTMLANLLDSLSQIPSLPPQVLSTITVASGFLVTVLHHLSSGKQPDLPKNPNAVLTGGVPALPASEAITEPVRAEDLIAVTPDLAKPRTKKE